MGQVLQAGAGQITARQAAVKAGIPMSVPATTVNKVCLSGLNSIYLADQMIQSGEAEIVVAGGMESMTNAPYLLPEARAGFRAGDKTVVDSLMYDGLFCAFDLCAMGLGTENYTKQAQGITREPPGRVRRQLARAGVRRDEGRPFRRRDRRRWPSRSARATRSSSRATRAYGRARRSRASVACGPRSTPTGRSPPATRRRSPTAAAPWWSPRRPRPSASARRPSVRSWATARWPGPDASLLTQPSRAILRALERAGKSLADIELFEINEAFAAVGLASMDDLGIGDDMVNVNGGAIALGHPIGMSGSRLALTLLHELKRRGGGLGAAALCGGGGQGDALLVRTL